MIFTLIFGLFALVVLVTKIHHYLAQVPCTSTASLVGKTALVTGGSCGIGYQIVLGLASRGCKVIVADHIISEDIKDAAIKETVNPNIIFKYINLASFKSVRQFADDIKTSHEKIDILINNAGIGQGFHVVTEDGIRMTMQVNYYSAFLLTHLLLDLLKKASSGGRIIFTTSNMSCIVPLITRNIQNGIERGREFFSYPISKYCQISASETFAEKLKNHNITSNCFHPYVAKTQIFKTVEGSHWIDYPLSGILGILALIVGKTPNESAQTGIYLACANEIRNVSGEFFGNNKPAYKPFGIKNKKKREAIWEHSEKVVQLKPEEKI